MKIKLSLLFFSMCFWVNAQIPIEGTAVDFTATDINGNVHHLQDYLDDGKTVVLDFFCTWCTPCWGYHSSHVFSDLYQAYGPNGSDELVILTIECDPDTNMDDLLGLTEASRGNWLEGTPYPVIDDYTIQFDYPVTGYPEWIKIYPDGSQFFIQGSASNPDVYGHYTNQMSGPMGPLSGIENHAEIKTNSVRICTTSGINDVDFELVNYGTNDISNIEVALKEDGVIIHSKTFEEETLEMYSHLSDKFSDIEFNSGHNYTLEVTAINGQPAFQGTLESTVIDIDPTPVVGNSLIINVYTDYYPAEISWDMTDTDGNIIIADGPYQPGNDNISGGGGPDGLAMKSYTVTLPEGSQECYHVNLYDEYGDGWNTVLDSGIQTGIEIIANGNPALFIDGMDFGHQINQRYAFKTNGTLSVGDSLNLKTFSIYPNPSSGVFTINTNEAISVSVTDMTGKVVFSPQNKNIGDILDLSMLQQGIYIAKVEKSGKAYTEKLIIR